MKEKNTKKISMEPFKDSKVVDMFSDMENRHFFHNAISFFKKETLIDRPFNEALVGKEDRYWARDIIDSGGKTLYLPSVEVDHHYTANGNT